MAHKRNHSMKAWRERSSTPESKPKPKAKTKAKAKPKATDAADE